MIMNGSWVFFHSLNSEKNKQKKFQPNHGDDFEIDLNCDKTNDEFYPCLYLSEHLYILMIN